ncbi:hypothetical protein JCM8547_003371 [Rhodosporidiobolus lusitaniae]
MGLAIKPATPGTIVVLAATVLLILVSVSTPLIKGLYFLKANLDISVGSTDISGDVTLGTWGYCVSGTCTDPKLGYSLDIASLFDVDGEVLGIKTNSVLKWITYLLILHPIAAAFGLVSVLFGLLAHMHNFAGTALTTCFASFAATIGFLAFIFDIVVFVIAKKRIGSSSGGTQAELGNAIWMTLAASILYTLSGCFFGFGACVIRKRRAGREASEKNRPVVDEEYGANMRKEALLADTQHRKEGTLPNFAEHDRNEQIPLNSMQNGDYDDDHHCGQQYQPVRFASSTDVGAPSIISGVGEGYGRRNPAAPGMPVSLAADSPSGSFAPLPVGGVGSKLGAEARANRGRATSTDEYRLNAPARQGSQTTEPFTGMYDSNTATSSSVYHDPYATSTSPPPLPPRQQQDGLLSMPVPNVGGAPSPTYSQHVSPSYGGAYPPYPASNVSASTYTPPAAAAAGLPPSTSSYLGYGGNEKQQYQQQPYSSSTSPPPQQQFYVQNGQDSHHLYPHATGDSQSIAPTYYTHDAQQGSYGGGGGGGMPMPSMPEQYAQGGQGQGSSADQYGTPYGYQGGGRY